MLVFTIKIRLGRVSIVIIYIEQLGRMMEQLRFSRGLVTPLILYGRVYSHVVLESYSDQSL